MEFSTNAGEGLYTFQYNEHAVDTEGMVISDSLPPGLFNVTCLLDGQPSTNITYSLGNGNDDVYSSSGDGVWNVSSSMVDGDTNATSSLQGEDGEMFEVDPNTGALSLQDGMELDYEDEMEIRFNVTCSVPSAASDGRAKVVFRVLPVNEYSPVLSTRTLYARVSEDVAIGTVLISTRSGVGAIATFSATDEDEGADGELEYTLTFNESLACCLLDRSLGMITISQALDVDNTPFGFIVETIRLTVCDVNPAVPSCPNVEVSLVITSANDNSPVFAEDTYQVRISEDIPSGFIIANVSCTDADIGAGQFGGVTPSMNLFNVTLQRSEQIISLSRMLDFETARSHNVTLTCFDTSGSIAIALLLVTVQPVNDNWPQFTENEFFFTISQLLTTGKEIGRVEAIDRDQVVGGNLNYSMMENEDFQIQNDGTIIFSGIVGFEEGEMFELTVEVSDGKFSDNTTVVITVENPITVNETINEFNETSITLDVSPITVNESLITQNDIKRGGVLIAPETILIGTTVFFSMFFVFCCMCYCCYRYFRK